jgi:hypothetical protein
MEAVRYYGIRLVAYVCSGEVSDRIQVCHGTLILGYICFSISFTFVFARVSHDDNNGAAGFIRFHHHLLGLLRFNLPNPILDEINTKTLVGSNRNVVFLIPLASSTVWQRRQE